MKGKKEMSPFYYVLSMIFLFGTPLIIFAMKYISSAYQARAKASADEAYRDLAQKAATAQSETAASLAAMKSELAAIGTRLSAVETVLKAVE
jgi:cbb3-type cytochrome oxidase subunit 3